MNRLVSNFFIITILVSISMGQEKNLAVQKIVEIRENLIKQADDLLQKKLEILQNEHDKVVANANQNCLLQLKRL